MNRDERSTTPSDKTVSFNFVLRASHANKPSAMNETEAARNIAIRWFNEVWNQGRTESIYELLAPDARGHLEGELDIVGPELFAAFQKSLLNGLPDARSNS